MMFINKDYLLVGAALLISTTSIYATNLNTQKYKEEYNSILLEYKYQEENLSKSNKYKELSSGIKKLNSIDIPAPPLSLILKEINSIDSSIVVTNITYQSSKDTTNAIPLVEDKDNKQKDTNTEVEAIRIPETEETKEVYISLRGNILPLLKELDNKISYKISKYSFYDDVQQVTIQVRR